MSLVRCISVATTARKLGKTWFMLCFMEGHTTVTDTPIGIDTPPAHAVQALAEAVIRDFYETLLDREPGDAELGEWRDVLIGGTAIRDIRAAFLNSEEYRRRDERRALIDLVGASGLLDRDWYRATYADVAEAGLDPLAHYCGFGMAEGRAPNAWLAPYWYREQNGLAQVGDSFAHYLAVGETNRLAPGPDFDPVWYRAMHGLSDTTPALADFLAQSGDGRVAPCPRLWSAARAPNPDGRDPYAPYLQTFGAHAGPLSADSEVIRATGLFDANFYAMHSADVLEQGMDPLEHFCRFGWQEGRDPSFYFRLRWYADTNPEVERLRVNPLVHYALVGEPAGRRPAVYFDPAWYRTTYALEDGVSPLGHYLANRRKQQFSPNPLFDPVWYRAQDGVRLNANRDPFPHFMAAGMANDIRPSRDFDMKLWRARLRGRPSRHFTAQLAPERDNPLLLYLLSHYRH